MNASRIQPALFGGLVIGVLSALPIVSAGNLCCCLWVVSGGVVAAYLLQQGQSTPITQGDGAVVGLLAGAVGAFLYLLLSIPITLLMAPVQRMLLDRLIERAGTMPPAFRGYVNSYVGGAIGLMIGFVFMFVVGSTFSTLGGILGAAIFRKPWPSGPDHQAFQPS
jgi:hypothetical protein